jgi:acyl-CoA thioester hydrolase
MEEARWEWITRGGYGLSEIAQRRQGPTLLECTLRFRRELRNRQVVRVRSWVEDYVGKVATVRQDMFSDEVQPSCSATMLMGLFDVEARKLIVPSAEWLACLGLGPSDWQPKR